MKRGKARGKKKKKKGMNRNDFLTPFRGQSSGSRVDKSMVGIISRRRFVGIIIRYVALNDKVGTRVRSTI